MAEPVRARRLTDQEGRRLQQIVRRGKHGSVRVRRAMIIMASASGTPVPAIARLVAADEDTVRDVVHLFNAKGLAALDPQWAGGRPRLISDDDIAIIVEAATTRPEKLGLPVTCWSLRKLAAYLAGAARPVAIGRERLRQILHAQGISFQRTRTWKESTDPVREAKLDRIEHVTSHFPDRCFAFDQFGPLSIRPTHGSSWARRSKPARLRATYRRTQGIRYFHGCYRLADDQLWGITRERKGGDHTLAALKSIRARCPGGYRLYVILDNLSANKTPAIRRWARQHNVELCFTPTNASWANPIEAQFGPIRTFVMGGSDHPNHTVLARKLQEHLRWRNANARHPDVLAAQRRERARIRSQRQQRWGRPASKPPDPVNVRGHRTSEYPVSVPCRYRLPAPFGSVRPNVSGSGSTTRRVCGSAGAVNSRSSAPSCCSLVWAEIRATTGRLSLNRRHLVPPLRKIIPAWTLLRDALQRIRDYGLGPARLGG